MDFDKLFEGPAVLAKQLEMRWGGFSSSLSSSSSSLSSSSSSLSSSSSSSSSATTRDNWQQRHHYPATSEQQQVQAAQVTSLKCNYCQKPFTSLRGYTYHLERAVCQKGKGSQQGAAAAAAIANADAESLEETSADTYSTAGDAKISPAADDAKTKNDKQPLLRDAVGGDRDDRDDPVSMSTNTATTTKAIMNRPYLRRTLLYCRDPLDKNYFPLWKDRQRSAEVGQELPQLDILAQLFGHDEPQEYNAALLDDENTWQYYQRVGGTNIVGNDDDKNGSNASSDGASMNSSEENRDVSVMKTPPPRKRKRRITPTTTPASKSAKQNRAGRRLPSRPESDGSGCGNEVSSPSSSTSSTSSSSSSRQHTKLFFDVQMAQSPSKVLSPTTAEMKYGKAFPPYQPRDQTTGKWIPPQKPRSAYELFADSTRGQARLHLKRRDRNNQEKVDGQLEKLWANGNTTTVLYWKQEEEWDRQRYLYEKGIYTRAQQLAANYAKADDANSGRNGEHHSSATTSNRTCTIVPRRVASVYYHYFYHQKGLPMAQIEQRKDCRCPFCYENCITDVGCIMHCQIVHGGDGLLTFQGMKDEEGILHIGVHPNAHESEKTPWGDDRLLGCVRATGHQRGWDPANALQQKPLVNARLKNFVYSRRGTYGPRLTEVLFLKRPFTAAAALDVQDRKRKAQFLRDQGVGEDTVRRIVPNDQIPVRQYYHSKTNLPMRQGEWAEDSDDESDDSWIDKKSSLLIDEFDDVSEKEKYFLKLWNLFINGSHKLVADRSIPSRCVEFIKVHGIDIAQRNMRELLLLHFCNLWDEEILSSDHISALMKFFDRNCAEAEVPGKGNSKSATRALPRTAKSPNHRHKTPTKHGSSSQKSPGRSRMSATRKKAKRCIAF